MSFNVGDRVVLNLGDAEFKGVIVKDMSGSFVFKHEKVYIVKFDENLPNEYVWDTNENLVFENELDFLENE